MSAAFRSHEDGLIRNDMEQAFVRSLAERLQKQGETALPDADLAKLYRVTTGNLNKAFKRNGQRFPPDFIFQLTGEETTALIFQSGRSNARGGRRHNPYTFTEQGVAMLSSVLRSERAVPVNVAIRCSL